MHRKPNPIRLSSQPGFLPNNWYGYRGQVRCTDIGTRVVVAICLSGHHDDPSWLDGPPYAGAEVIFDEDDLKACEQI